LLSAGWLRRLNISSAALLVSLNPIAQGFLLLSLPAPVFLCLASLQEGSAGSAGQEGCLLCLLPSAFSSPSSSSSIAFASSLVVPLPAGVQRAERFALIRLPPRLDLLPKGFRLVLSPAECRNRLLHLSSAFLHAETHLLLAHPRPFPKAPRTCSAPAPWPPPARSGVLGWIRAQFLPPGAACSPPDATDLRGGCGSVWQSSASIPPRTRLAAPRASTMHRLRRLLRARILLRPGELPCQEPLVGRSWLGQPP